MSSLLLGARGSDMWETSTRAWESWARGNGKTCEARAKFKSPVASSGNIGGLGSLAGRWLSRAVGADDVQLTRLVGLERVPWLDPRLSMWGGSRTGKSRVDLRPALASLTCFFLISFASEKLIFPSLLFFKRVFPETWRVVVWAGDLSKFEWDIHIEFLHLSHKMDYPGRSSVCLYPVGCERVRIQWQTKR